MPKVQERQSNVRIKKADPKEEDASSGGIASLVRIVMGKSLFRQAATAVVIVAIVFGVILYRSTSQAIKNLVNVEPDSLKDAFFGDKPHLFVCDRGLGNNNIGTTPAIFSDLNIIKGNIISFATVNCSQVLPSGKTIMERFKLKKEWKPTIFGTAPWSKPIQAQPSALANVQSLKKFVEDSLSPKATVVESDKHLWQHCAFSKNLVYDDRDITETCVLLVKGSKFSSTAAQLEQRLVQSYPQVKFAMVEAAKLRMTFEDIDGMPHDYFALKVHALRNGTHFQSMVHPITWDYLNTFVSSAVAAPLYDYQGDSDETVHLMKVKDLRAKKEREAKRRAAQEQAKEKKRSKAENSQGSSSKTKKSGSKASTQKRSKDPNSEERIHKEVNEGEKPEVIINHDDMANVEDAALAEQNRRERERARREEMERQQREYLFTDSIDGDADDSTAMDDEEDEELDNSVIEL